MRGSFVVRGSDRLIIVPSRLYKDRLLNTFLKQSPEYRNDKDSFEARYPYTLIGGMLTSPFQNCSSVEEFKMSGRSIFQPTRVCPVSEVEAATKRSHFIRAFEH
jgi:hypothetical protein